VYLRSFLVHARRSWITQFYMQLHQCMLLSRWPKRSPDGASTD